MPLEAARLFRGRDTHGLRTALVFYRSAVGVLRRWGVWDPRLGALPAPDFRSVGVSARSVAEIEDWLLSHLRERLGPSAEEIDAHLPFSYYGLDSLDAVALTASSRNGLAWTVTPDVAWDYPTAHAVAAHLGTDDRPAVEPDTADMTFAALLLELEAGDAAN